MKHLIIRLVSISMFMLSVPASAEIYKSVNENGDTVYSDAKPEGEHSVISVDQNNDGFALTMPGLTDQELKAVQELDAAKVAKEHQPPLVLPSATAPTPRKHSATVLDLKKLDLCESDREDCFSAEMNQICLLRWGEACNSIYFWSACERKKCFANEEVCNSPFRALAERPFSVNERDLKVSLRTIIQSSEEDWQCLRSTGLFCKEMFHESECETRYGQSCEAIKGWVATAIEKCESQQAGDCLSLVQIIKHRPVSSDERDRVGRGINGAKRDRLREQYAFDRDEPKDRERMDKVLSELPMGNRNLYRSFLRCERELDSLLRYEAL